MWKTFFVAFLGLKRPGLGRCTRSFAAWIPTWTAASRRAKFVVGGGAWRSSPQELQQQFLDLTQLSQEGGTLARFKKSHKGGWDKKCKQKQEMYIGPYLDICTVHIVYLMNHWLVFYTVRHGAWSIFDVAMPQCHSNHGRGPSWHCTATVCDSMQVGHWRSMVERISRKLNHM